MDWLSVGLTALNVAGNLFSGSQASRTANNNAATAMNYAIANSAAIREAGRINANNIMTAGKVNAMLASKGSQIQAELIGHMGEVNAYIARQTAAFNSLLMETEIKGYLQEKDFALTELEKEFNLYKGAVIAHQAGSGTVIGEGSNAQTIINSQAQYELNKFVLNHNYDKKIRDVSNQMMINTFQGELAARKYEVEARSNMIATLTGGAMEAGGIMAQAGIDASAVKTNSAISAWQTYHQGMWDSKQYEQRGKQAWTSGIFNAVSSGIDTFARFGGFDTSESLLSEI